MLAVNVERRNGLLAAHVIQDKHKRGGEVLVNALLDLLGHIFVLLVRLNELIRLLVARQNVSVHLVVPADLHGCHFCTAPLYAK